MPIYEFECEECGSRFEELLPGDAGEIACPQLRVDPGPAADVDRRAARAPAARGGGAV